MAGFHLEFVCSMEIELFYSILDDISRRSKIVS